MLIPAVYMGHQGLKGKSSTEVMEYYLTATQLFVALGAACKHLVLSYKRIQALSGTNISNNISVYLYLYLYIYRVSYYLRG